MAQKWGYAGIMYVYAPSPYELLEARAIYCLKNSKSSVNAISDVHERND